MRNLAGAAWLIGLSIFALISCQSTQPRAAKNPVPDSKQKNDPSLEYDRFNIAYVEGLAVPDNFENQLCFDLDKGGFPEISLGWEQQEGHATENFAVTGVIKYDVPRVSYPFNPSLAALPDGFLFAFRFDCTERTPNHFQSYTLVSELDQDLRPRGHLQFLRRPSAKDPKVESHTAEDLRLFNWHGTMWAIANDNFDGVDTTWVTRRQTLYRLEKVAGKWTATEVTQFKRPQHSSLAGPEKNWTSLSVGPSSGPLVFNYFLQPHPEYVTAEQGKATDQLKETHLSYRCDTSSPWPDALGALRGGTPAIWLADRQKYLSFFHTVEQIPSGKFYHMGAFLISPDNFCITDISAGPLSYPGMYDEKKGFWANLAGPDTQVVFPMGIVDTKYKGQASLLLSLGVNDSALKIFVLKREETLAGLINTDDAMAQRLRQGPVETLEGQEKEAFAAFVKAHKITASLTTSPTRIKYLRPLINSLAQEPLLSRIYLALPLAFGKKKESYSIPSWLNDKTFPKLKILRPTEDIGPISKMIFAVRDLRAEGDPDAVVISVDDDTGYARDTYAQLIKHVMLNPRAVVGGSSQPLKFWDIDNTQAHHWSAGKESKVIEGFGAIAYRVGLVDDGLMEKVARANRYCFASDDIVISFALDRKGVERLRIGNAFMGIDKNFQYTWGFGRDALHKGAGLSEQTAGDLNALKYQKCNEFLKTN